MRDQILSVKFYLRDTALVARELIGKILVCGGREVVIVETEAYLGESDPACHTWKGRSTERVKPMWEQGGRAYVYLIYGIYNCLNVVTKKESQPEAVLIRAAVDRAWLDQPGGVDLKKYSGPGKLCREMGIDRSYSGISLLGPEMIIESLANRKQPEVVVGSRIGVDYAGAAAKWPLRFGWAGCRAVTNINKLVVPGKRAKNLL